MGTPAMAPAASGVPASMRPTMEGVEALKAAMRGAVPSDSWRPPKPTAQGAPAGGRGRGPGIGSFFGQEERLQAVVDAAAAHEAKMQEAVRSFAPKTESLGRMAVVGEVVGVPLYDNHGMTLEEAQEALNTAKNAKAAADKQLEDLRESVGSQLEQEAVREAKKLATKPNYAAWKDGDEALVASRGVRDRAQSVDAGLANARGKGNPGKLAEAKSLNKAAKEAAKAAKKAAKEAKNAAKYGSREDAETAAQKAKDAAAWAEVAASQAEGALADALDEEESPDPAGTDTGAAKPPDSTPVVHVVDTYHVCGDPKVGCAAVDLVCGINETVFCQYLLEVDGGAGRPKGEPKGVKGKGDMAAGDSKGSTADSQATSTTDAGAPTTSPAAGPTGKSGEGNKTISDPPKETDPGLTDEVVLRHAVRVLEGLVRKIKRIDREVAAIEDRVRPWRDKLRRHKPLSPGERKAFERASLERALLLDARSDLVRLVKGTLSLQARALKTRGEVRGRTIEAMASLSDLGDLVTDSAFDAVATVRKGRKEVGLTYSPGDYAAAESLMLLARSTLPDPGWAPGAAQRQRIFDARKAIFDLGWNPDSAGAKDVAESLNRRRVDSEMEAAWEEAERGTTFWGSAGRALRAGEKFIFEVPVTALQGAWSGFIGKSIELLETVGLNPTPLSSDAFLRTSEVQFKESLNALKDTGRLFGNTSVELVEDRIGMATRGGASMVPTVDEQLVGEEWLLGAARSTSHFVGPTIVVAGGVALGGGSGGAGASGRAGLGGRAGVSGRAGITGAVGGADDAARIARYLEQGYSPRAAKVLAQQYEGVGHHLLHESYVKKVLIPKYGEDSLRGRFLKAFVDSPWNVKKPDWMSTGEFYEFHARLHGAGGTAAFGRRTAQGMRLLKGEPWRSAQVVEGLESYNKLQYLWYGSTTRLKVAAGAAGAGLTGAGYAAWEVLSPDDSGQGE